MQDVTSQLWWPASLITGGALGGKVGGGRRRISQGRRYAGGGRGGNSSSLPSSSCQADADPGGEERQQLLSSLSTAVVCSSNLNGGLKNADKNRSLRGPDVTWGEHCYQCCGSGIRCLFVPWMIRNRSFLDPGSRIQNPYFWELNDNCLGRKF